MAIDPISRKAFRTPLFVAGVLMLIVGMVPVAVGVISGWNRDCRALFPHGFRSHWCNSDGRGEVESIQ